MEEGELDLEKTSFYPNCHKGMTEEHAVLYEITYYCSRLCVVKLDYGGGTL